MEEEHHSKNHWLALASFEAFGSRTLRRLWDAFRGDGEAAFFCSREALMNANVREKTISHFLTWRSLHPPDEAVARCAKEEIRFVLYEDPEYPELLRHIHAAPFGLFLRGAQLTTQPTVTIVGTRAVTAYGKRVIEHLVPGLVQHGFAIASGLALGADAEAHAQALEAGGTTVAVLAGGIDTMSVSPRRNIALARRILESRGTLISESPPGTVSLSHLFPLRNRILAGMSAKTVVIEAAEASGSLITARLALEENRDVYAVPGSIFSLVSAGTHLLLSQGAAPCARAEDIIGEPTSGSAPTVNVSAQPLPDLSEQQLRILSKIPACPTADDLGRALAIPIHTLGQELSNLEIDGLICDLGGQRYELTDRSCQILKRVIISPRLNS